METFSLRVAGPSGIRPNCLTGQSAPANRTWYFLCFSEEIVNNCEGWKLRKYFDCQESISSYCNQTDKLHISLNGFMTSAGFIIIPKPFRDRWAAPVGIYSVTNKNQSCMFKFWHHCAQSPSSSRSRSERALSKCSNCIVSSVKLYIKMYTT